MSALLERRPYFVFALLVAYFAFNVALRLLLPASLELDEAEQMLVSQWLALGYNSQPPLYNWLQYGLNSVLGPSVLSLALLKNGMLLAAYVLMGLTAFGLLRDKRLAIVAALGLLTIPQISYETQRDLTHTVAVIFSVALFLFGMFRTLRKPDLLSYAVTGAAVGIGIVSKYNFLLLPASVFVALLWSREFRQRVLDWRVALAVVIALALLLPHAVWFLNHTDHATARTIAKLTEDAPSDMFRQMLQGLYSLVKGTASVAAVAFLVFVIAFGKEMFSALRAGNDWTRLLERTWLVALVALLGLVLFFGVAEIRDRWLIPLVMPLPLYLCLKLEAAGADSRKPFRIFLAIAVAIMVLTPSILGLRIVTAGWTGHYQKLNVPYGPMVERLVGEAREAPGVIVAGDGQLAGVVRLHARGVPVMAPGIPQFQPDIPEGKPVLVVWRYGRRASEAGASPEMPGNVARFIGQKLPAARSVGAPQALNVPYHYGAPGDTYRFYYQWMELPAQ